MVDGRDMGLNKEVYGSKIKVVINPFDGERSMDPSKGLMNLKFYRTSLGHVRLSTQSFNKISDGEVGSFGSLHMD